jgi:Histidine phosphatase superfamily (branch 1)
MSVSVVFETHSITVDNEQGRATGWLPGELSERGRGLARALGRRRADDGIAVVLCSDLVPYPGGRAGVPLEQLIAEDFAWREGWEYQLSSLR